MKQIGTVSRILTVLTVMMALAGVRGGVYAQDGGDPTATDTGVAEESSPNYVGVSCWPAGDGTQTTCSFTGYASDGSWVEALWVPAWIACAEVVDAAGTDWTGDGYHVESDNLALTFAGAVNPGDSAGYVIRVNGSPVEVTGDGLVCGEESGDWSTGDAGTAEEGDVPADETVTDVGTEETAEHSGDTEEWTDTSEEEVASPEATDEGSGDEAADTSEEEPQAEITADPIHVLVIVYNCSTDPGATDPGSYGDCELAEGVDVTASADGNDLGTQTTSGGATTFSAPEGSSFFASEDVPDDYHPLGNGTSTIDSVANGATVVFVNVLKDLLGRLQIVNGLCPANEPTNTEFFVVPPKSLQASAEPSCEPTEGAVFVITGGTLPEDGIVAITDEHGIWRGYLAPGEYNILDDGGDSVDVPVVADEVTAVVVIDYFVPVTASLTISKVLCTDGEEEGTFITVSDSEGDEGGESCEPANGEFMLEEQAEVSAQDAITFSLGSDGVWSSNLPVGSYLLTDLDSGESADVNLEEGASTFAAVRTVSLHGTLVVRHFICDDPDSNNQDPSDFTYWDENCPQPNGGVDLTLFDNNGDPVDTKTGSGGGVITWQSVDPGTYTVDSDDGLCASFVDGVDASGGFEVEAGATTVVRVFTCAPPDDGDGTGGDDDGDDDADDDDDTGDDDADDDDDDADDDDDTDDVTTLPSTGIGNPTNNGANSLALLGLTLPVLLAGAAAARRRTRYGR